ncbi:hypothetical protein B0H13DRAFT_2313493 [Mycena leptocephala]|nr:hypothetical protein B0H13DRAFT_2313493 [Mycena leptocephala]
MTQPVSSVTRVVSDASLVLEILLCVESADLPHTALVQNIFRRWSQSILFHTIRLHPTSHPRQLRQATKVARVLSGSPILSAYVHRLEVPFVPEPLRMPAGAQLVNLFSLTVRSWINSVAVADICVELLRQLLACRSLTELTFVGNFFSPATLHHALDGCSPHVWSVDVVAADVHQAPTHADSLVNRSATAVAITHLSLAVGSMESYQPSALDFSNLTSLKVNRLRSLFPHQSPTVTHLEVVDVSSRRPQDFIVAFGALRSLVVGVSVWKLPQVVPMLEALPTHNRLRKLQICTDLHLLGLEAVACRNALRGFGFMFTQCLAHVPRLKSLQLRPPPGRNLTEDELQHARDALYRIYDVTAALQVLVCNSDT